MERSGKIRAARYISVLFRSDPERNSEMCKKKDRPPVYQKKAYIFTNRRRVKETEISFLQAEREKERMEELLLTGELDELMELCEENGRVLVYSEDGVIITFDEYQWTDKQTFKSIDEAVKWEKGYQR